MSRVAAVPRPDVAQLVWRNRRAIRDALVLVGLLRAAVYYLVQGIHPWEWPGLDARAYWRVDLAHPYAGSALGLPTTYLYSPVFAQLLAPFGLLPFPIFFALWTAMLLAVLWWLVRPWPWALGILALPVSYELFMGNVHLLLAAMVVVGFRQPAAWVLALITKITPGVGLLWFAVRRELRPLAIAVGVTAALSLVSFLLAPTAWREWIALLTGSTGSAEALVPRLALAAVLVAVAALVRRPWLVPIAVCLAMPVVWVNSYCVLLAIVRLAGLGERPPVERVLEPDLA